MATKKQLAVLVSMALAVFACGDGGGSPGIDEVDAAEAGPVVEEDASVAPDEDDAGEEDTTAPVCSEGEVGCPCGFNDSCDDGECVAGVCTDCAPGERDCVCGGMNSCEAQLVCGDDGLCDLCAAGSEGCACDGDRCDTGLVCSNDVCAAPSCAAGTEGCPCDSGSCDDGLFCRNELCLGCNNSVSGCPCEEGACSGGRVCGDDDRCRLPLDCAKLAEEGSCLPFQACDQVSGSDAFCVPETCVDGYEWVVDGQAPDADSGAVSGSCQELTGCTDLKNLGECGEHQLCEVDPSTKVASCLEGCIDNYVWVVDEDGQGSCQLPPCQANSTDLNTLTECTAEYRGCYRDASDIPHCGECKAFAVEDENGDCQPAFPCPEDTEDGMCGEGEFCHPGIGCEPLPCAQGQARSGDSCAPCSNNCIFAGQTGRVWQLERDVNGQCVCETQEGYFMKSGGAAAASACDADGDGWVTRELLVSGIQNDLAYWHNNRCRERSVDRIQLRNEYHQRVDVVTCEEAPYLRQVDAAGERPSDCFPVPLVLAEPEDLDRPGRPAFPKVEFGRNFVAAELNALTKVCSNVAGDFNLDSVADVQDVQTAFAGSLGFNDAGNGLISQNANQALWHDFAYFMELYEGFYMAAGVSDPDPTYVIAEKSRCEPGQGTAPIGGRTALDYSGIDDNDYWRSCYRGRDTAYDATTPDVGFDFAQFTCDSAAGGCDIPAPPLAQGLDTELPRGDVAGTVAPHGLCDLNSAPRGASWMGMNHHSQFQCVVLLDSLPDQPARYEMLKGAVADVYFNVCSAKVCDGDGSCNEALPDGGSGPTLPAIECTQGKARAGEAFSGDTVGWVVRPFTESYADGNEKATRGAENYVRGCIDESAHWYGLCTAYDEDYPDPDAAGPTYRECGISMSCTGSAPSTAGSGELSCACNGGADSQKACRKVWGIVDTSATGTFYPYEVLTWDYGAWN